MTFGKIVNTAGIIFFVLGAAVLLAGAAIWCVGLFQRGAREQIIRAADYAHAGRFLEARRSVQGAIRLKSAIQRDPDAVSLYRIILGGALEGNIGEIERVREVAVRWPRSRWEKYAAHPIIRFGVPLIWFAQLAIQAVGLFGKR